MTRELMAAGLAPEHVDMLYEKYEEARAAEELERAQRGAQQGEAKPYIQPLPKWTHRASMKRQSR